MRFVLENGHMFIISRKGGVHLVHNNFVYRSNLRRQGRDLNKIYWECIYNRSTKCRGRLKTVGDQLFVTNGTLHKYFSIIQQQQQKQPLQKNIFIVLCWP